MSRSDNASPATVLFAVSVSGFLMPFMMSGAGVALPTVGAHFNANAVEMGLSVTAYMSSIAIFTLAMGRVGDLKGRCRVFNTGMVLFTVFAGLVALSWSMSSFIGLRFLHGVAGAMISSTGPAIVVSAYPPSERGRVLGITVGSVYAGLSTGPLLGGALVSAFGWRALFLFVVVLGAAILLVTAGKLKDEEIPPRSEPFDWRGSALYGFSILLVTLGSALLSKNHLAWWLIVAGTLGLAAFWLIESRTRHPLLDVALLKGNRLFLMSNAASLINYSATFGIAFFMSLYLQLVKGMSPHMAGLTLAAQPLTQALLSPFCGRLSDRMPAARVATAGMALCALGLAAAALIGQDTSLIILVAILVSMGAGFALFSSPNMSLTLGSVEHAKLGLASGLASSMRTLGMTVSMTLITVLLSIFMGTEGISPATRDAFLTCMSASFWIFSFLCVLGVFCSYGRLAVPKP